MKSKSLLYTCGSGLGAWTEGGKSNPRDIVRRIRLSSERLPLRGKVLSDLMTEWNLTAERVGELLGVSRETVRKAIKGKGAFSSERHLMLRMRLVDERERKAHPEMFLNR
jgi:hypothetical protein